jgi:hypothetical protein
VRGEYQQQQNKIIKKKLDDQNLKQSKEKKNYILNSKRVVSHFVPQLLPTKFIHSF